MEGALKVRVALMIPSNIGTFSAQVGEIGQVCFDEGGAAVHLRKISNRLSRTQEIRVTKRLANLVLSLALLSAYSVAQETEETTGAVHGVATADADGGRVVMPRIKVALNGPTHIEAVSNDEGKLRSAPCLSVLTKLPLKCPDYLRHRK